MHGDHSKVIKVLPDIQFEYGGNSGHSRLHSIVDTNQFSVLKHVASSRLRLALNSVILGLLLTAVPPGLFSRQNAGFDVRLRVDYSSAEELLQYFARQSFNAQRVAGLRGNQIAAATSVMLARTTRPADDFAQQLQLSLDRYGDGDDIYGLRQTRSHVEELRKLLAETQKRQMERRVIATLQSYFPPDTKVSVDIPVYVVAVGNEKAAAFVRRVVWQDDTPVFVGEPDGEQVIVLNLARVLPYDQKVEGQFIQLMSTLAHECFHAVFGAFQQSSPAWNVTQKRNDPVWRLAELVENEGIAYCLSLQLQIGGRTPPQAWFDATTRAVDSFNAASQELISPTVSPQRARDLILNSNLSGSFEGNYGATAGLRMAYEIDTRLGRPALTRTISGGIREFFGTYDTLCRGNADLPQIDRAILNVLER